MQNQSTAGKAILTAFWNSEGDVLTDILGKGATVNSVLKPYNIYILYWNPNIYIYIYKASQGRRRNDDVLLQQENAKPHKHCHN
jgi:hypothetical protein